MLVAFNFLGGALCPPEEMPEAPLPGDEIFLPHPCGERKWFRIQRREWMDGVCGCYVALSDRYEPKLDRRPN